MKRKHIPWLVLLLVLLADQVSKVLVKTNMTLGESIPVLGDWFIIHFTENYGMAFGMEFSGEYGKLFLSVFRILAVVLIGWYLHRLVLKKAHKGLITCVSLIFAGAIGNIIDSAFYGMLFNESHGQVAQFLPEEGGYGTFLHGKVVDMLYFPLITGTFPSWVPFWGDQPFVFFRPVFNIADAAITSGVFAIIIFQKRFFTVPGKKHAAEAGLPAEDNQSAEERQSAEDLPADGHTDVVGAPVSHKGDQEKNSSAGASKGNDNASA